MSHGYGVEIHQINGSELYFAYASRGEIFSEWTGEGCGRNPIEGESSIHQAVMSRER